jgi:hypothetical protein
LLSLASRIENADLGGALVPPAEEHPLGPAPRPDAIVLG